MNPKTVGEPGMLETDSIPVRVMNKGDLEAVVSIDAAATGRRRPRYFELMLERAVTQAALQVSLAAELDGRVVGFVIASLYYGEYGVVEPTASLDAIGVLPAYRGQHVAKAAALNGYMSEEQAQGALREAFLATFETGARPTSGKLRGPIKH